MKSTYVNGIQLAYERHGTGTPMVLLHGYPLDHHLWDDVTPLLSDGFDLIIPDLRGFGESSTTEALHTMEDFAADIAALLDQLQIQKAAIVGHSMGGYVALAFARLYPKRITGLGLVGSQTLADPPDRREGRYKSAAEVATQGIAGVVTAMTSKFTADPRLQEFARQTMEKQQPAAYIGALKAMAERSDSTPVLSTLDVPIVLVHGTADALIPVDRARELKTALPDVHLVEIAGAGHIPMMEAPKQTADALRFLA